jgi:hypothetical protein
VKVPFTLVKSFLRQALQSAPGVWVTSLDAALTALNAVQASYYTEGTTDDTTVIASTVEGKTFQFQVTPGLSKSAVMGICEEAMELIEVMQSANDVAASPLTDAQLVERFRHKYLRRSPRTRTNYRGFQF